MSIVHVVCAWIMRGDGRILLVRKAGTEIFQFAGGKPDAGETAPEALRRELREELGCDLAAEPDFWAGEPLQAPAANERGFVVSATMMTVRLADTPKPCAEIAELAWVDRAGRDEQGSEMICAPLTAVAWAAYAGVMISAKSVASRA